MPEHVVKSNFKLQFGQALGSVACRIIFISPDQFQDLPERPLVQMAKEDLMREIPHRPRTK